ncbi:ABC transporter substrate-binding protein [Klebsiella electrica]|uniref:ABC transporter substrate-binding protein n=1 Tax=Klebsiella electrica TaxID=1259973 RepID=UPI00255223A1|nr:ABC transporter substrate-binding protein [Klebsiella electrica]WIO42208.1 ABC transporter substrate-binding protein [Klebsiella electrica]
MKKCLSLGYLATTLGLALGLASAANATDATLSPGKIKIAMEVAYPPFESWQDDAIVGFDAELAALLSQQTGLTLQLVDTKFSSLILGLSGGRQDAVISALYITEERTRQADAIPYANTGAYIMVRSDSPVAPQTEHDLCGLTVGLQQGTSWVKKLQALSAGDCQQQGKGAIEIKEFPTSPETLQALLSGNIQAQVDIAGVVSLFTQRSKGRLKVSSPQTIYPQTLGIYVRKGNTALAQQLTSALKTLRDNGEYHALLQKYAAYGITDNAPQP